MDEHKNRSLDERIERLEREIEEVRIELRHLLAEKGHGEPEGELREAQSATTTPSLVPETAAPATGPGGVTPEKTTTVSYDSSEHGESSSGSSPERGSRMPFDLENLGDPRSGEWWLNKLGIGLLLFGVAFLFMYSVEKGWLTPPVQVGIGLTIGTALLGIGLRIYEDRRAFSQVLLGGGIGALYITGFAAFQLYALVPYPLAFAFMVAVTLLAYVLSLQQNEVPLSLVGALGGLGTPFLLYNESGTLSGLVLYTCLILAGMVTVYFYKGWISLLAVSFAAGWLVFLVGYVNDFSFRAVPSLGDRWTLELGVAFAGLLFWLVPVAREVLRGSGRGTVPAHLCIVSTPIIALGYTSAIWKLPSFDLGWITLSNAVLYALAAIALRSIRSSGLSYTHALVALLLLTLTFILMLRGDALFFTLAVEAAVLHLVARRFSDDVISVGAHLLFSAVSLWLTTRFMPAFQEGIPNAAPPGLFDVSALVDLAVIALALGISGFVLPRDLSLIYRIATHASFLALLWRELSVLPGGDGWVTVAWGLYAVGLLVAGLRLNRTSLVRGGMATLFLVVGKLFLVDLAEVEAIWRVLLFLGFGGLFLALSYYLRSLWRPEAGPRRHGS